MCKVALVTGGSSGIGRCAAKALLDAGCAVYELSRRDIPQAGIIHLTADITEDTQVRQAVAKVIEAEGRIDILVNNAGYGISGAAEATDPAASHRQLEVNLFGLDNVTRAVLPQMRTQGSGRIVCLSSIAGILPIPFQLWYSVSKSAIASYCLALANEVRPYRISVCAILPGDIATGFTDARQKDERADAAYGGRVSRSVAGMERDERGGMNPEYAGRFVAKYALKKNSRPLVAMGFSYKCVAVLTKLLPRRWSNWIVGKLYAK